MMEYVEKRRCYSDINRILNGIVAFSFLFAMEEGRNLSTDPECSNTTTDTTYESSDNGSNSKANCCANLCTNGCDCPSTPDSCGVGNHVLGIVCSGNLTSAKFNGVRPGCGNKRHNTDQCVSTNH